MRLTPLVSAAFVLSMSGPSFAQEWIEFASREDRFTCNFPGRTKVTETSRLERGANCRRASTVRLKARAATR